MDNPVLKIYNGYKTQIGTDVALTATETGKYQYDYTIPDDVIGLW